MSYLRPWRHGGRDVLRIASNAQLGPACARLLRTSAASGAGAQAAVADEIEEPIHVVEPDPSMVESFKTENRLKRRRSQLPGSRYQYHPPKYDRGPLHPVQSPARSDPIARDFMAGPFNYPRLRQTFEHTVSSDLLTLTYQHTPPGTPPSEPPKQRLRRWEGDSPYFENRQLRPPRGSPYLRILEREVTPTNMPEIRAIHLDMFFADGTITRDGLNIARAVMQSISGRVPRSTWIRNGVATWSTKSGDTAGCKVSIFGDQAVEFVDKLVNLVLPKFKDWQGVKAGGDRSGNVSFGLTSNQMVGFPEIETNFDMYPSKSIPGCSFVIETSATSDRQARLLLSALGMPFAPKSFE